MTQQQPPTDERLAQIEARVNAAEDGWHVVIDETNPHRHEIHGDGPTHVAVFGGEWDDAFASYPVEANAEFAAHARADVPVLLAEVRRRVETVALPARWDCAHGVADDEPFCAEAEDDGHVCPTIRVHPSDAEAFAALVTSAAGQLPAWEAMYEPGNVSDYLIGYTNSEAGAKGAAEAWMRSQAEVTGRLEWVPQTPLDGYDQEFELIERHDDGADTGPGITVRRRAVVSAAAETSEKQPEPERAYGPDNHSEIAMRGWTA